MSFRKKATLKQIKFASSKQTKVYLNDKPVEYYNPTSYYQAQTQKVASLLKKGIYLLRLKGGGLVSQLELLPKVLYGLLQKAEKDLVKEQFTGIDRTDVRRNYPKRYGGPKSRARFQKSYR